MMEKYRYGGYNMYESLLRKLADQIEETRIDIYSRLDTEEDRPDIDDKLFSLQSKLRDISDWVGCYEE